MVTLFRSIIFVLVLDVIGNKSQMVRSNITLVVIGFVSRFCSLSGLENGRILKRKPFHLAFSLSCKDTWMFDCVTSPGVHMWDSFHLSDTRIMNPTSIFVLCLEVARFTIPRSRDGPVRPVPLPSPSHQHFPRNESWLFLEGFILSFKNKKKSNIEDSWDCLKTSISKTFETVLPCLSHLSPSLHHATVLCLPK